MRALSAALLSIVILAACGPAETDSVPVADAAAAADAETQEAQPMLGGCILLSPIGEVPADVYEITDVTATDAYPPFTKELTARGLKLVARDDASDDFMRLVGKTIGEVFPRDDNLDLALQEEILTNHYRYKAVIPVPVGDDRSFRGDDEAAWDRTSGQNSICDIIMQDVPEGQVMEVVEHILHYVSDMGLHTTFPDEWGINETSALAQAMQRSIDEGYYNIEQYSDERGERGDGVMHRVIMQEFAYWIISTAWNLQEAYGPQGGDEWTIKNEADLQEKLPEFYEVYQHTVGRTMVAPSLETLREIGPTRAEEDQ